MQVGRFRVSTHNHGFFRLDGGAMFGSVPKALWQKVAPPDEANRILLATRSMVIEDESRRLIVDLGCGDKWTEKPRAIFSIEEGPYLPVSGITDVLLTHLHFDHAGGVSRFGEDGAIELCYPKAKHHAPAANLANAKSPNERERASYLPENIDALQLANLQLFEDGDEIWPGLTVHRADGHTTGLHWIKLEGGGTTIVYPADLMPTSGHLPVPYVMGYDMCAAKAMEEKRAFLESAIEENWIVVFEHDPGIAAARLKRNEQGRAVIGEEIEI